MSKLQTELRQGAGTTKKPKKREADTEEDTTKVEIAENGGRTEMGTKRTGEENPTEQNHGNTETKRERRKDRLYGS